MEKTYLTFEGKFVGYLEGIYTKVNMHIVGSNRANMMRCVFPRGHSSKPTIIYDFEFSILFCARYSLDHLMCIRRPEYTKRGEEQEENKYGRSRH